MPSRDDETIVTEPYLEKKQDLVYDTRDGLFNAIRDSRRQSEFLMIDEYDEFSEQLDELEKGLKDLISDTIGPSINGSTAALFSGQPTKLYSKSNIMN